MEEIRKIKLFLASSTVEFAKERMELGFHILKLNNMLIDRGVYLWLSVAETLPRAMTPQGLQDYYNSEIRDSRYFYTIVGRKVGEGTQEEFEMAWKHYKETGLPEIHTYFLQMPGLEDESVRAFKDRLKGLKHYYDKFDSLDTIKLSIQNDALRLALDIP